MMPRADNAKQTKKWQRSRHTAICRKINFTNIKIIRDRKSDNIEGIQNARFVNIRNCAITQWPKIFKHKPTKLAGPDVPFLSNKHTQGVSGWTLRRLYPFGHIHQDSFIGLEEKQTSVNRAELTAICLAVRNRWRISVQIANWSCLATTGCVSMALTCGSAIGKRVHGPEMDDHTTTKEFGPLEGSGFSNRWPQECWLQRSIQTYFCARGNIW